MVVFSCVAYGGTTASIARNNSRSVSVGSWLRKGVRVFGAWSGWCRACCRTWRAATPRDREWANTQQWRMGISLRAVVLLSPGGKGSLCMRGDRVCVDVARD